MKITVLVEGKTEMAFKPILHRFLRARLEQMPRLHFSPYDGRIPKEGKLKRRVENLLVYCATSSLTNSRMLGLAILLVLLEFSSAELRGLCGRLPSKQQNHRRGR